MLFPSPLTCSKYKELKSKYQRLLKKSKKQSWTDFCTNDFNGNLFGTLKKFSSPKSKQNTLPISLLVNNVLTTNVPDILNSFSKHFFPFKPIDQLGHLDQLKSLSEKLSCTSSIDTNPFSLEELEKVFQCQKTTKSPGPDGLSISWLKLPFQFVKLDLLSIFNACKNINYFPSSLREANVLVLKKHNKPSYDSPSPYRPISILNSISKIFKRLILNRLVFLADDLCWFNSSQHGFIPGRSTETACSSLVSFVEQNRSATKATCTAFLDIKSAFDYAWHPAILLGLIKKNCPLNLVRLIQSFLSSRSMMISSGDERNYQT